MPKIRSTNVSKYRSTNVMNKRIIFMDIHKKEIKLKNFMVNVPLLGVKKNSIHEQFQFNVLKYEFYTYDYYVGT